MAALIHSRVDDFVLLHIFDHLSFFDLLNVASIDPRYEQLIAQHQMPHKYRIDANVVRIDGGGRYDQATGDVLTIGKYSQILTFLRLFGHLVTRVYFSGFSYNGAERDQIARSLLECCAQSLVELELCESGGLLINETAGSFPHLAKLTMRDERTLYANQRIHRIYPALKELTLAIGASATTDDTMDYFCDLLRSLPDLRGFGLTRVPSMAYVQAIEQHLPHLEALTIDYIPNMDAYSNGSNGGRIHFSHVRHLSLDIHFYNLADQIVQFPLTFEHLQTLEIATTKIEFVPWNLFDENRQLKALAFPTVTHLRRLADFMQLLNATHAIDEISVQWTRFMGSDDVVRLMTEFERLQKIKFIVWDTLERPVNRDALLALVPAEWYAMVAQKDAVYGRTLHHIVLQRFANGY